MNYIREINAFYDLVYVKQLSTGQIALWHALMQINNKCAWTKWFTAPNLTLELTTGLSRKGIYNARNALKQHGIIDFKSNGQKATSYKLVSLLNNTQPTTQDIRCLQDITQDTTQGTTQLTTQGTTQDSATLNKLKETKLKEIKSNVPASAEDATPELKEECRYQEDSTEYKAAIYLREQILNFNPKCKVPADTVKALQQWADTIRLMFERDKRTKEELHKMVKYIFQSPQGEFWRPNVQSPAGLRRNWDTIYGQMIQKDNSKNKSSAKKTAFNNLEGREWDFDKLQKLENERRERLNKELDVIMGGA